MADNNDWKKDFDPKAAAEARKQELDGMMTKIEKGVTDCFNSEDYRKLMTVMARMPHYSVNNQILIMLQNPEATMCNSFSGWKKQGRYVKQGEKGLRILAPAPYQMEKEQEKVGADGKAILDKDGEPVKETVKITVNAFKPVSTFDIFEELKKILEKYGYTCNAPKSGSSHYTFRKVGCNPIPDPNSLDAYSGQFKIRVLKSLHRTLSINSKKEGVSMNQYCVYLLSKNDAAHVI